LIIASLFVCCSTLVHIVYLVCLTEPPCLFHASPYTPMFVCHAYAVSLCCSCCRHMPPPAWFHLPDSCKCVMSAPMRCRRFYDALLTFTPLMLCRPPFFRCLCHHMPFFVISPVVCSFSYLLRCFAIAFRRLSIDVRLLPPAMPPAMFRLPARCHAASCLPPAYVINLHSLHDFDCSC